mgnify:CR=1 FL=1
MSNQDQAGSLLIELTEVMDKLRAPDGCPWDREQSHVSLMPYLLEEAYEVLEAIQLADMHKLAEELGDLLLQIVFHAQIAKEQGEFDLSEPIRQIVAKLKRRHPHVFGQTKVASSEQVLANWEAIKAQERKGNSNVSLLDTVPRNMPALMQAYKIQQKAARVGFDWEDIGGAYAKVTEEKAELMEAVATGDQAKISEELGDLMFAVVNVARFLAVEPETALLYTVIKFRHRFSYIEEQARAAGQDLTAYSLSELDEWWEEAKQRS